MATYGEVKTEFSALLNRRDATSTQITTFLQNSIRRAERKLRIPAMEKSVNITVGSDYIGLPIPSDFLQLIRISDEDDKELKLHDFTDVAYLAQATGTPRIFTRRGSYWLLGPAPAAAEVFRVDYYGECDEVSADADDNMLTLIAPDLLIYGALVFAAKHFTDKRLPVFEDTWQQIIDEMHDQAARDELSGGAVVRIANPFPSDEE